VKVILGMGVFAVTAVMMTAVGMELQTRHFVCVPRLKRLILFLLIVPAVVLPLLACLLVRLFSIPPELSAGILLMAACPVGDIANFYVLLARGNAVLTLVIDTLTCLLSAAMMWVIFRMYYFLLPHSFVFAIPDTALILRMTLLVAVPVMIGIGLRHFTPQFVERSAGVFRKLTLAGIVFVLAYVFFMQREQLALQWRQTALLAAGFICVAMCCGLLSGFLLRLNSDDRFTVGVIFAVRNVGLAMAIAVTLLNRNEYALFAAVYFLVEVPLLLAAVAMHRKFSRNFSTTATKLRTQPIYERDSTCA
jgi:BASS family bile acid:Na+ symporter